MADHPANPDYSSPAPVVPNSLSADGIARLLAIFCIFSAIGFGIYWRFIETDRPTTIHSYMTLQQGLTKAADQSPVIFMRFQNLQGKKAAVAAFSYFLGNYVVYPRRIIVGEPANGPILNSAEDILAASRNTTNEWAIAHGAKISFTISGDGDHPTIDERFLSPYPKALTP